MNRDCVWCAALGKRCKALDDAVCEIRKCSFYEKFDEFNKRMEEFDKLALKRKNKENLAFSVKIWKES